MRLLNFKLKFYCSSEITKVRRIILKCKDLLEVLRTLKYFRLLLLPNLRTGMILTFTFALIICVGTLMPLPQAVDILETDKWYYFVAFAALTYPLTVANRRCWFLIIAFGLSFGALIEIIQPYVNRFGDVADFTADAVGVLIGFSFGVVGYFSKLKIDNLECLLK